MKDKIISFINYIDYDVDLRRKNEYDDKTKITLGLFPHLDSDSFDGYLSFVYETYDEDNDSLDNFDENTEFSLDNCDYVCDNKDDEDSLDDFFSTTDAAELMRFMSIRDAKRFAKELKTNTGINLSYRNFCIYPAEINNPDSNSSAWLNYIRNNKNN